MDIKKLPQADMDRKRTTGFLLGLVISLSLLFVAFEFSFDFDINTNLESLFEDSEEDIELESLMKEKKVAVAPAQSEPSVSDQIRVVEDNVELQQPDEVNKETDNESESTTDGQGVDLLLADEEVVIAPPDNSLTDELKPFRVVRDLPQFPGGAVELMRWLTKNLRYPKSVQQRKIQGRVVTQFIVNTDGSISDIRVVEKLDPLCDREALRVLRMMPKWKPGIENDAPCRTLVCIPIVFKL